MMRRNATIVIQFLAGILFGISSVLYFIGGKVLLGFIFLALTLVYLMLGVFYVKHYKG
ncbi:hypothetical protein KHM83_04485 [Fusibacter paucivorans]|uniref:Uncharacterized protein n=1 Tax=Fusibacter paucivorans TaxID=76009 RepID=A0ABS5PNG1_9FIRM|nr:hypothetical protein [Fusibacter paucivorans]MBS7525934.1 hypothetical protein [Fusibacter paucivorans]